jgi:hypothetical protein
MSTYLGPAIHQAIERLQQASTRKNFNWLPTNQSFMHAGTREGRSGETETETETATQRVEIHNLRKTKEGLKK